MKPITLDQATIDLLVGKFPKNSEKNNQQLRLFQYLATHPKAVTVAVNQATAVGNISAASRKANKVLMRFGYMIACQRPADTIYNRFNEPSHMYEWGVYEFEADRMLTSANDE